MLLQVEELDPTPAVFTSGRIMPINAKDGCRRTVILCPLCSLCLPFLLILLLFPPPRTRSAYSLLLFDCDPVFDISNNPPFGAGTTYELPAFSAVVSAV
jgi:hypothetical protein